MNLRALAWAGVCLLVAVEAGLSFAATPAEELGRAESMWSRRKPNAYRFTFQLDCFCPPEIRVPVTFIIRRGAPTEAHFVHTLNEHGRRVFDRYDSIEKLFGVVRAGIERGAAEIRVQYDPDFGFPKRVYIDHDRRIVDEETTFSVTNFAPVGSSNR